MICFCFLLVFSKIACTFVSMFTVFFLLVLFVLDGVGVLGIWFAYRRQARTKRGFVWGHICVSLLLLAVLVLYRATLSKNYINLATRHTVALSIVWIYISKILTIIAYSLSFGVGKAFSILRKHTPQDEKLTTEETMNRAQFLERISLATGTISFGVGFWGTNNTLYDYQLKQVPLKISHLPKAFHGLRIAQISDIHVGSLTNTLAVKGGLEMLLREKPDVICFTGDLVNYEAYEIIRFEHLFSTLKAPLGVFSCLGNHDYGDYTTWANPQAKAHNMQQLIHAHKKLGWHLLIDSHTYIEASGEKIAMLGVGNWSKIRKFPRYGKLAKAFENIDKEVTTQILLSHDPSHWDAEIRPQTPSIYLTLSGHTHGMQMGIEWGNIKISPAQFVFEQWAGLYQKENQYLYVNRGFGYTDGFPMRLGILPEITIFTLQA